MSIPLGQLQANDISIPISIYHNGGSLRVAEGEGDCGLGWSLSAGGSVSRVIRGLPDEINEAGKKGWLFNNNAQNVQSFTPTADDNLAVCSDEVSDWNFLNNLVGSYSNDTEPDLFYISAPGLSAQFVFGPDGLPKLLSHQDIVIQFYGDSVTVKNNRGLVYSFARVDLTQRIAFRKDSTVMNTESSYYRTLPPSYLPYLLRVKWNLTAITSPVTGTRATFNYQAIPTEGSRRYFDIDSLNSITDFLRFPVIAGVANGRAELNSISLKSYTATFEWSNSLLRGVVISEANTLDRKVFRFEYQSSRQQGVSWQNHVYKGILKKIKFDAGNCLPAEMYQFSYDNVADDGFLFEVPNYVSWKKNWGQDFFGYPNGEVNNKNIPALYAYYNDVDGRRLRVTTIPGQTPSFATSGQIRTPNTSLYSYGALTKIILPSGGYTEIQYEPNKYVDNSTFEEFNGPGKRVKKLISQGGEIAFGKAITDGNNYRAIIKEYEYVNPALSPSGTLSSGLILSPVKLGYITRTGIESSVDNLGEAPEVLYTRVKEKVSGQGSMVYEYTIPGVFPETISGDWKATRSRIARKPGGTCVTAGNIKNGYYTFPYAPSTNYNFKRGQLAKISEYSETNVLIREKTYTYSRRTQDPSTIKGLRFEEIGGIVYHYGIYEILTGQMEVLTQEVVKEASHENPSSWLQSTTAYAYNSNHMVESITTTLPDNTVTTKRFKYAKDFSFGAPPSTDTAAVALRALNDSFRGSEVVEQITKVTLPGSSEQVTGAQLVIYRDFGNNRVLPYYIKTFPQGAAFTEATVSGQNFASDADYIPVRTLKEYDNEGRILTEMDAGKNTVAYHYSVGPYLPMATLANVRAQQAVVENFEMTSSFGLTTNGTGFQYPAGWTGSKAIQFTNSSSTLVSSVSAPVKKNGSKYRVSCWIYSGQNKTITFNAKSGETTTGTVTLTNTADNKWNYLEGVMDMAGAGNTFTLEVITNATIGQPVTVDDIVFIPAQGRITLQTILPLKGVTSATDDNGNSIKSIYDPMGRVVSILDRNRNLLQRNEYVVKNSQSPLPVASFTSNTEQYFIDIPATFTPGVGPCDAGNTYAWEVDGIGQSSGAGNVLTHTFTTPGEHNIKLTATSTLGVSWSFVESVCVEYQFTGTIGIIVTDANGNPAGTTLDCNSGTREISVTLNGSAVPPGCELIVTWTKNGLPYTSGGSISVTGIAVSGSEPISETYEAQATLDCSSFKDCVLSSPVGYSSTVSIGVTYVPSTCQ